MQDNNKKEITFSISKKTFVYILSIIGITLSVIVLFFNSEQLFSFFDRIWSAFSPVFIGIIVAFIFNSFLNLFEKIIFKPLNKRFKNGKMWNKIRRPITVLCSYIFVISILALIFIIIIPELGKSIELFAVSASENLPIYAQNATDWVEGFIEENNLDIDLYALQNTLFESFDVGMIAQNLTEAASDVFSSIVEATFNFATGVFTGILSFIFSIYFLAGKEKVIMTCKKMLYSYVPRRTANKVSMFLSLCNKIFSSYIKGQLTECVILGILCFIGMSIIGLEYQLLISVVVALFALIPLIGAFVGAAVGALLLLLVNPMDAFWFVIFFILLQQFEGNVIYPRVVGSSLGLPGVWTLIAVTVMGGLFGIMGILLGTPIAAVIYYLFRHSTRVRLKNSEITQEVLDGSEYKLIYKDILEPYSDAKDNPHKINVSFVGKIINFFKRKIKK